MRLLLLLKLPTSVPGPRPSSLDSLAGNHSRARTRAIFQGCQLTSSTAESLYRSTARKSTSKPANSTRRVRRSEILSTAASVQSNGVRARMLLTMTQLKWNRKPEPVPNWATGPPPTLTCLRLSRTPNHLLRLLLI